MSSLYPEPFDPASLPPLELSYLLTCTLRLLSSLNLSLADESPPALGDGRSALAKTQVRHAHAPTARRRAGPTTTTKPQPRPLPAAHTPVA